MQRLETMSGKGENSESNIVVAAIAVGVMALAAVSLLLFALVVYLAEAIESLTLSLCIVGGVLSLAAYTTFRVVLHPALRQLREEYKVITQVATLINNGYNWVHELLSLLK